MAKLMMNGIQVGGTNGSASSVTCENGKTVEERLTTLDTAISSINSNKVNTSCFSYSNGTLNINI